MLVDTNPFGFGGARESLRVFQWVQVAAARIEQAREVAFTLYMGVQGGPVQETDRAVIVLVLQFMHPVGQFADLSRLDRDMQVIPVVIAGDGVPPDQGLREVERLDRKIKDAARIGNAYLCDELVLSYGKAKDRLATAATGGPEAHLIRLQEPDPIAALG